MVVAHIVVISADVLYIYGDLDISLIAIYQEKCVDPEAYSNGKFFELEAAQSRHFALCMVVVVHELGFDWLITLKIGFVVIVEVGQPARGEKCHCRD